MKPNSQMTLDKYFRQCVGIDISKDKFTAKIMLPASLFAEDFGQFAETICWGEIFAVPLHRQTKENSFCRDK